MTTVPKYKHYVRRENAVIGDRTIDAWVVRDHSRRRVGMVSVSYPSAWEKAFDMAYRRSASLNPVMWTERQVLSHWFKKVRSW